MVTIENAKIYRHHGWLAASVLFLIFSLLFLFAYGFSWALFFAIGAIHFLMQHSFLKEARIERITITDDNIKMIKASPEAETIPVSSVEECTENAEGILIKYAKDSDRQLCRLYQTDFDAQSWQLIQSELARLQPRVTR